MKILVDHGSGYNLGDIAMLEASVSRLANIFKDASISVIDRPGLITTLWNTPNVVKQKAYKIKLRGAGLLDSVPFLWRCDKYWYKLITNFVLLFFGNASYRALGEFCKPFDALYISGGGNLTNLFYNSLFNKCCLMAAFISQDKPVMLTGQQIGPFNSYLSRMNLSKILEKVNFIGLRDPGDSLDFVKSAHINESHFDITGDDSFGLLPLDDLTVLESLHPYNVKPNGFIAINFRMGEYATDMKKNLRRAALLFDRVAERMQMPMLIIPISHNAIDNDVVSARELLKFMKGTNVKIFEYPNPTPALIKGILGKSCGAVGTSYHFCTFALSMGVPAICIYDGDYYSQKAKSLSLFWKNENLALPLRKMNMDCAVQQIIDIFKDEKLRKQIKLRYEEAYTKWHNILDDRIRNILVKT